MKQLKRSFKDAKNVSVPLIVSRLVRNVFNVCIHIGLSELVCIYAYF